MTTKAKTTLDPTKLSPLERKKKISVREAAEFNDIHVATFRRHFGHLIHRVGPPRQVVELGDAIDLSPTKVG